MRTEKINGLELKIYDSIEDLPIKRFHKFNKYLLVDSGIGSDINDINAHISKVYRYVDTDKDLAKQQLSNLRQSMFMVAEEVNSKHLSLIPLIYSIDGKELTDLSDENIKRISESLSHMKVSFFNRVFGSVKKKIDNDLETYFPLQFNDATVRDYFDRLRSKTLLELDTIIRGSDNDELINKIDDFLVSLAKPKVFSGKDSVEITYDKQFEDMCLFFMQEVKGDIDKTTVLQFYNAFEYIKKQRK